MHKVVDYRASVATFVASGPIVVPVYPIPYTMTRLDVILDAVVTTTTVTINQDYLQRIFSTLSLVSNLGSHINLSDMRPTHFQNKAVWGGAFVQPKAPGNSATAVHRRLIWRFDFGVNPMDPFDLSSGIPYNVSSLSLNGTWGAATDGGTNCTTQAATALSLHAYGIQPDAGDPDGAALPKAYPRFRTEKLVPTSTNGAGSLGYAWNIPRDGNLLHDITIMAANGTAPTDTRSDSVITDFGVLVKGGNEKDLQFEWNYEKQNTRGGGINDDDGSTLSTPEITLPGDIGVVHVPIYRFAMNGVQPYGADLRKGAEGSEKLAFSVGHASSDAIWMYLQEHQLVNA